AARLLRALRLHPRVHALERRLAAGLSPEPRSALKAPHPPAPRTTVDNFGPFCILYITDSFLYIRNTHTRPKPTVRAGGERVTPVLQVSDLRKSFGPVEALRGADLDLYAGEVLAVVGDNGAGKSTLIKHIAGVYRPDAGRMLLAGAPLDVSSPR